MRTAIVTLKVEYDEQIGPLEEVDWNETQFAENEKVEVISIQEIALGTETEPVA